MSIRTLMTCGMALLLLVGCSNTPIAPEQSASTLTKSVELGEKGSEITLFALGLIDTGYHFGGKNPEAGLDCSGMVSYIYSKAADLNIGGSAADMARKGRSIQRNKLRPGDLVFFNTRNAPFSHVGVYIGDDRFVHAPSENGRVRIDHINTSYYAQRFQAARTYFD